MFSKPLGDGTNTPLVPARQRQLDFWVWSQQAWSIEQVQDSQGYTETLKKQKFQKKKKQKLYSSNIYKPYQLMYLRSFNLFKIKLLCNQNGISGFCCIRAILCFSYGGGRVLTSLQKTE